MSAFLHVSGLVANIGKTFDPYINVVYVVQNTNINAYRKHYFFLHQNRVLWELTDFEKVQKFHTFVDTASSLTG